jgi:peptidoglycan/xylan/chitin deacetylase (PgdA/CDA1 family)
MDLLKSATRIGLHRTGGLALVRRLKTGLRIVMYHRFTHHHAADLQDQCRHLRRYYHPVSMRQVADSLKSGTPLPPNAVAVTVDDGYRDFLEYAAPVFKSFDIPATVYLATAFLDRELWLWWDSIDYALRHTSLKTVLVNGETLPIATAEEFAASFYRITSYAKTLPNTGRLQFIDDLLRQLAVRLPAELPAEYAPLRWEEVRQLRGQGFEFGSHSVTHPILSRLETPEALEHEVFGSRDRIQQETEEPVLHFCYPNGQPQDWNETVVDAVSRAGFVTGVTTVQGLNREVRSPLSLQRLAVDVPLPLYYFAESVVGLH